MSIPPESPPEGKVRDWFHHVGNVFGFFWAAARAVINLLLGRWPGAEGRARRVRPKPPTEGKGPIARIAPFPTDD